MLLDFAEAMAHAVVAFVRAVLLDFILFNIGRGALLACTFGRYPRGRALERDSGRIAAAGLAVALLTATALAVYNSLFAAF